MNARDEMADDSVTASNWFGFDQLRLTDDENAVIVTIGSPERWDKSHLRRLRQSADLPGLVPVVDADLASDGKPYAVTPDVDAGTLADRLPPSGSDWPDCAAITEAAARAAHEAHLRGLFHGALSPDQIFVLDDDVAVAGVGLGLGGHAAAEYENWMAPEVREGGDATERSDVYSLGKVLEASLGESIDDVPRSVRRLIMWSSSDTPEARPPSALEFASILAEAMGEDRPSYSPAFIPTAEITDLASTASEAVAGHVPSSRPESGRPPMGGLAAAGAGGIIASSLVGDDDTAAVDEPKPRDDEIDDEIDDEAPDDEPAAGAGDDGGAGDDDGGDGGDGGGGDDGAGDDAGGGDDDAGGGDDDAGGGDDDAGGGDDGAGDDAGGGDDDAGDDDDAEDAADDATTTSDVAAGGSSVAEATTTDASAADPETGVEDEGFDSREYVDGIHDDDEGYDLPAAARTIDIDAVPGEEERRSSRAGIVIAAILLAGLGLVAFRLLSSDDDADDESVTSADEAAETEDGADGSDTESDSDGAGGSDTESDSGDADTTVTSPSEDADTESDASVGATTEQPTTTTTSTTTTSTTEQQTTTSTSTTEQTTTTSQTTATTGTGPLTEAAPLATGPIEASEAAVQFLHGVPGVDADLYLNGEALVSGFQPGTIAGPADLAPGTYDIAVYPAIDSPPTDASARTDDPAVSQTVTVGSDPVTLVAHLDDAGTPTLSSFAENLGTLAPGQSRIEVRHLAAAPGLELTIDGDPLGGPLESGKSSSVVLAAGDHELEASTAGGELVKSATITVTDGELASITLIGSADGGIDVAIQRYTGLGSAPTGVPTGNSNLLGAGEDETGLYLLAAIAALMAIGGGIVTIRRSRRVL